MNVTIDNSPDTNFATHIREYTVSANPDIADPGSVREILSFAQPFGNHNGGWIGFSPNDDHLYIASGDGGSGGDPLNSGQSLDTLLGKMQRIDVNGDDFPGDPNANYAIPPSNPFVGTAGAREEIWAWGLRNPWRSSFDADTGDLWIGDVGQNQREEIGLPTLDQHGWRKLRLEPPRRLPAVQRRAVVYRAMSNRFTTTSMAMGRSRAILSSAGHVYRGPVGAFEGLYIFADSRSSNVWSFNPSDPINTVQRIT